MPQFLPFAKKLHVHLPESQTSLAAEAVPQIPNVWKLKCLFCSWDASVDRTLPHTSIPAVVTDAPASSFSSFSSDPVYFSLMCYINLVFHFSFLPSLIHTLTVLAVLKHDLSSFPMPPPSRPCQLPCTSISSGCLHLQVSNSISEASFPLTVFHDCLFHMMNLNASTAAEYWIAGDPSAWFAESHTLKSSDTAWDKLSLWRPIHMELF